MIYLDNAATSLRRPEGVVRAVSEALCSLGNVGRGASESALSANTTKTNPSGRYAAGFGRSQNKILEFNEKQALSDIWQCLLLLYLFDFFRLDTAKKINLDNDRKFLYNKIRSGIRKILL